MAANMAAIIVLVVKGSNPAFVLFLNKKSLYLGFEH